MSWRTLIPRLVQSGQYSRQADLVRELANRGFQVNQGTISRELASQGIQKVDGVYRMPDRSGPAAPVHSIAATKDGTLAVVKTDPAHASVLGQYIDEAEIPGLLGTIAGDDTVFVALFEPAAIDTLADLIGVDRR